MKTRITIIAVALISLSGCGGPGDSGLEVSRDEFDGLWPFTVGSGTVDCVDGQAAIFKTGGHSYQLNGFARSRGYDPVDSIWRDNPDIPEAKVSLREMIDLALSQC